MYKHATKEHKKHAKKVIKAVVMDYNSNPYNSTKVCILDAKIHTEHTETFENRPFNFKEQNGTAYFYLIAVDTVYYSVQYIIFADKSAKTEIDCIGRGI